MLYFLLCFVLLLAGAQQTMEVRAKDRAAFEAMKADSKHFMRTTTPGSFIATIQQVEKLKERGHKLIEDHDLNHAVQKMRFRDPTENLLGYQSHEAMNSEMQNLTEVHKGVAFLQYLGHSVKGRQIFGVHLSQCGEAGCAAKPRVAFMGPVHGDEVVGRELCMRFLRDVLKSHQEVQGTTGSTYYETLISTVLDKVDLLIVPQLNPDGFANAKRLSAHYKDLNRAMPDRCGWSEEEGIHWTDGDLDEPEAKAIADFTLKWNPTGMLWFHGGAEVISYPYDDRCGPTGVEHGGQTTPEEQLILEFSKEYSYANPAMYGSTHWDEGVTNGAEWYTLTGGNQDFALLQNNRTVYSATAEVSGVKLPDAYDVETTYWPQNRVSMAKFAHKFVQGLSGRVVDSKGKILHKAKIFAIPTMLYDPSFQVHPEETSFPIAVNEAGYFQRPLAQGSWEVIATCSQYTGSRFTVNVRRGEDVVHDFVLH